MPEKEKLKQRLSEIERRRNTIPTALRQLSTKYDDLEEKMLRDGDVAPRDNTRIAWGRQTVPTHTQLASTRYQMRRLVQEDKDLETERQEIINDLTKIEEREAKQKRFANMSDSERKAWVEKQQAKTEGLSEADSARDWYHAIEENPQKRAEFDRQADIVSSVGSTIATLPFTAGIMGWVPAITTTATGTAGGYVGAAGGQELGQYLDNKYGWNTTPYLRTIGGFTGGILGGGLGYKGWEGATNQYLINKAFKSGQLKYGQPTAYTAYHQSSTPITKFKFPFKERWDVRTHGADPNGAFFTVEKPAGSGFLAERPYTGQFYIKVQKPLIQTGELSGPTKNSLRNAIVRRARKDGADAVFFDGIADNTLQNQQILFAMDNADIGYRGMIKSPNSLTLAERLGIPKGERSNPKVLDNPQYWGYKQWNERYNTAVKAGNWEEVQRLRDLHFMSKAPDTKVIDENGIPLEIYHFSHNPRLKYDWYPDKRKPLYLTSSKTGEEIYYPLDASSSQKRRSYYLKMNNPLQEIHEAHVTPRMRDSEHFKKQMRRSESAREEILNYWRNKRLELDNLSYEARLAGNKDLSSKYGEQAFDLSQKYILPYVSREIPLKWKDLYYPDFDFYDLLSNELRSDGVIHDIWKTRHYLIYNPENIKLSKAITFDDNGEIIPIVKRDNFRNLDTRYNNGGKIENPDQ